ncbi:MAG TPA: hypothetical protein VIF11_00750 [Methylomirabilota bacterium]|jgi:hypothetical protein
MKGKTLSACALLLALSLATFDAAHAHGLIGKRFFPATLAPTILSWPTNCPCRPSAISSSGAPRRRPRRRKSTLEGTGSKKVDAESFNTWTPQLFFGKGFGDLPDQLELMKPFAVTGVLGLAVPSRVHTKTFETDEDGNVDVKKPLNPTVFQWGFSFQYNLQYLQSYVRDVGLPAPINRMIPIVELVMETPVDGRDAGRTTGTVNPGIIWFGRYFQLGIEAVIPVNHDISKNIGALAQIHFYLDDNPNAVIVEAPGYTGRDGRSIMPDYRDSLSTRDLIDLIAYLKSLGG